MFPESAQIIKDSQLLNLMRSKSSSYFFTITLRIQFHANKRFLNIAYQYERFIYYVKDIHFINLKWVLMAVDVYCVVQCSVNPTKPLSHSLGLEQCACTMQSWKTQVPPLSRPVQHSPDHGGALVGSIIVGPLLNLVGGP